MNTCTRRYISLPEWSSTFLLSLALLIAFSISVMRPATVAAQETDATPAAAATPEIVTDEAPATTGPQQVSIGFYLEHVYDLDQQASTYYLDFYLWMRWNGEIDPTASFEMLNNVERWGTTQTPLYEEPLVSDDGTNYQIFHIQGQFFQPLALSDYPIDDHALTIAIEDGVYAQDQLTYVLDSASTAISPDLKLPGWKIKGFTLTSPNDTYATDFGAADASSPTYSSAVFALNVERPLSFFEWKLLLPLVIVLLLGCSVLVVHPSFTEVRLAGPATAMLSLIFLQQSYSSSLPENGGLVLLDKIYGLAFVLVIGLIISTIVTSHWIRVDEHANAARAGRLDRIASIGLFAIFVIGTVILIAAA